MDAKRVASILASLLACLLLSCLPLAGPSGNGALALPGPTPAAAATGPIPTALAAPSSAGGSPGRAGTQLEQRLGQWPLWQLPAPLRRAGREAPRWPTWFAGDWWVHSAALPVPADAEASGSGQTRPDAASEEPAPWRVRFLERDGAVVADRAFNAASLARTMLPGTRLQVQDDPTDPRRQLARLGPDQLLETTLLAWRVEQPSADLFLNDELSLEVLRGAGPPRLSRVETLGRWQRRSDGSIEGEQWQARYPGPDQGLIAGPVASEHLRLRLVPVPPGSDPAS